VALGKDPDWELLSADDRRELLRRSRSGGGSRGSGGGDGDSGGATRLGSSGKVAADDDGFLDAEAEGFRGSGVLLRPKRKSRFSLMSNASGLAVYALNGGARARGGGGSKLGVGSGSRSRSGAGVRAEGSGAVVVGGGEGSHRYAWLVARVGVAPDIGGGGGLLGDGIGGNLKCLGSANGAHSFGETDVKLYFALVAVDEADEADEAKEAKEAQGGDDEASAGTQQGGKRRRRQRSRRSRRELWRSDFVRDAGEYQTVRVRVDFGERGERGGGAAADAASVLAPSATDATPEMAGGGGGGTARSLAIPSEMRGVKRLLRLEVRSKAVAPSRGSGSSSSGAGRRREADHAAVFRGGGHRCANAVWIDPILVAAER
jgi:hypothetical protein